MLKQFSDDFKSLFSILYNDFLKNLFKFSGTTTRGSYWLAQLIITLPLVFLPHIIDLTIYTYIGIFLYIISIPIGIRRLRDVGKSPYNLLWILTIIGILYLLYLLLKSSKEPKPSTNSDQDQLAFYLSIMIIFPLGVLDIMSNPMMKTLTPVVENIDDRHTNITSYFLTGEVEKVFEYVDEKPSKATYYHKTGEVESVHEYADDKRSKATFYYKTGEVRKVDKYVDDKLSKTTNFFKNGEMKSVKDF